MMKEKEMSYYGQGQVCKVGRKFASYVLDLLTSLIVGVLLFWTAEAIMNSTSMMKGYQKTISSTYSEVIDIVEKSGISEADENENLVKQDTIVTNYIRGAVLHSLKANGVTNISEDTYKDYTEIDEKNDKAYYYFVTFKKDNLSDYETAGKENYGWKYYTEKLANGSDEACFDIDASNESYPLIKLDVATKIDNYFRDSSYSSGSSCYNSVYQCYSNVVTLGMDDLQKNYTPYIQKLTGYQSNLKKYYSIKEIELFITYCLSVFVVYALMPLIFKNGQTLAMKILKIGATDKRGMNLSWYQYLIKFVINLIEYMLVIAVVAFAYYGVDALDIIGNAFIWNISLLSLAAFSIVFVVLSFILTFCLRNTKQSISEYLSGEVVHDSDVFYVSEEVNEQEKQQS